jgi:hypothetical protein
MKKRRAASGSDAAHVIFVTLTSCDDDGAAMRLLRATGLTEGGIHLRTTASSLQFESAKPLTLMERSVLLYVAPPPPECFALPEWPPPPLECFPPPPPPLFPPPEERELECFPPPLLFPPLDFDDDDFEPPPESRGLAPPPPSAVGVSSLCCSAAPEKKISLSA